MDRKYVPSRQFLNSLETLMWRAETDVCRFDAVLIGVLDRAPEWEHLTSFCGHLARHLPRMRQRVGAAPAAGQRPAWTPDPAFAVTRHMRRIRAPGTGGPRELLDLAGRIAQSPLDRAKPLWSLALVEGLRGGEAAVVLRIHHAVTDGMGLWWALQARLPRSREASLAPVPAASCGFATRTHAPSPRPSGVTPYLLEKPAYAATYAERLAQSLRLLVPPPASPSPLLGGRSRAGRFEAEELPMARLRAVGRALDASLGALCTAGLLGALQDYHSHFGVRVHTIPMAVPVSLRSLADRGPQNSFGAVRLPVPMSAAGMADRVRTLERLLSRRTGGATDLAVPAAAEVLCPLPGFLSARIAWPLLRSSDLHTSTVPGFSRPVYLSGARVTAMLPFGPRGGSAAMAAFMPHGDRCAVGVHLDPAAITDPDLFSRLLHQNYDSLLASADGAPRRIRKSHGRGVAEVRNQTFERDEQLRE
ncbi:wax ester/triacylglycerol synthase domain-containing protein [Streptomyces paromomycinus]|uniref:diacylglycerol O-acyltransferase n=1 Tax=Streptomyces paromomycinus TaxID=92743 RepID=A0A401VV97_STREY|nr:wax ester/triacylglycerol synthase domain-containing protein [Streptomyces paromomycinus]GCD40994.1 diacylglycerol O-acyltransferase [Streptomyces paromomycinus]